MIWLLQYITFSNSVFQMVVFNKKVFLEYFHCINHSWVFLNHFEYLSKRPLSKDTNNIKTTKSNVFIWIEGFLLFFLHLHLRWAFSESLLHPLFLSLICGYYWWHVIFSFRWRAWRHIASIAWSNHCRSQCV